MKKFIFGLMLLVSMLGIVGCADPNNSDDPVEDVVYTIYNSIAEDSYYIRLYVNNNAISEPLEKGKSATVSASQVNNLQILVTSAGELPETYSDISSVENTSLVIFSTSTFSTALNYEVYYDSSFTWYRLKIKTN